MNSLINRTAVILLGEDDFADQELIKRGFKGGDDLDYELNIANDGEEVLDYLFRQGKYKDTAKYKIPDLIILDLNMPKFDGIEVLEQLSRDPYLRLIPVVVLTTSRDKKDILRCYELGANSYITKPSDLHSLNRTIKSLKEYWFSTVSLPEFQRQTDF